MASARDTDGGGRGTTNKGEKRRLVKKRKLCAKIAFVNARVGGLGGGRPGGT